LDAEDDEAGATKFYQVAVKLDPDDLFAWRGLSEITGMPEGDLFDRVRSNLVRLGDYQPSYLPNPEILDYRRFWLQVSTKGRGTLRFPEPVFELKASRAFLRKNGDPSFVSDRFNRPWAYGFGPPGETMPSDSLIQAILKYADSVRS